MMAAGSGQGFPPARQSSALTDPLIRPTKWEENPGRVAQLVEQRTENPCVAGSIPAPSTVWLWDRLMGIGQKTPGTNWLRAKKRAVPLRHRPSFCRAA
jgi:hypothetical protein